jgi:hypothetical protein
MPSYINIEDNERADKAAKEVTGKPISSGAERYSSFNYYYYFFIYPVKPLFSL